MRATAGWMNSDVEAFRAGERGDLERPEHDEPEADEFLGRREHVGVDGDEEQHGSAEEALDDHGARRHPIRSRRCDSRMLDRVETT
jgi:hypothetical protein